MTDDNDDSRPVSRRKALIGIGAAGAALGLGGVGTYAQFTDTEEQTATFSAGGIDGTITTVASYNGTALTGDEASSIVSLDGENAGATIHFEDVKPGDYGSFCFQLEVNNNPAWVASCTGIESSSDGTLWEPEAELESQDDTTSGTYVQSNNDAMDNTTYTSQAGYSQNSSADYYGSEGIGEMEENLLMIPYYNDSLEASFWDQGGDTNGDPQTLGSQNYNPSAFGTVATNENFWQKREGEDDDLLPRSVREVVSNAWSPGTTAFETPGSGFVTQPAGYDASDAFVQNGCIPLDGRLTENALSASDWPSETYFDSQSSSALQPGDQLHFGFDWHLPFGTGNEVQGDNLVVNTGFSFSQVRHTSAPEFANVYEPGINTPN